MKKMPPNSCNLGVLDNGEVVIQFDRLLMQMTFTPEQARQLGLAFIEMATRAESLHRAKRVPARAM